MNRIAITGGVASGKTTALCFFKELGAYVVSADDIVHKFMTSTSKIGKELIDWMGREIVSDEGNLDRKKIGELVFSSPEALSKLESILHPIVYEEIFRLSESAKQENRLFVAEIPLLFETGKEHFFDTTIYVDAPVKERCRRFCKKSGLEEKDFYNRQNRFIDPEIAKTKAHFVLNNDGNREHLKKQVLTLFKHLTGVTKKTP